jgi:hypothetical protein
MTPWAEMDMAQRVLARAAAEAGPTNRATVAISAALNQHQQHRDINEDTSVCGTCKQPWPCRTVRAMAGALGADSGG